MKNHRILISIASIFLVTHIPTAGAELVVIANPHVSFNSLTQGQLRRIFLGQTSKFPNGEVAEPLDLGGEYRNEFYEDLLKKSPSQVDNYWANMIFSGKASPPRQIRPEDVKQAVAGSVRAISYIDRTQVSPSVKIISITEEK